MRWLKLWIDALVPDEPLILGEDQWPPNFPERLPRSVKYWCVTVTAVNAVVLTITALALRSAGPLLVFILMTAAGPIGVALTWQSTVQHLNSNFAKFDDFRAMTPFTINLSIEWCAIFALVSLSFTVVVMTIVLGAYSHQS
jgi:hypothetical protein